MAGYRTSTGSFDDYGFGYRKVPHSNAPDDDKLRVRNAASLEIRMRLIGGYLIRTNQITLARLNPKPIKAKPAPKRPKQSNLPKRRRSTR